ncbi:MAG: EAL domain-containing protein [Gammaproteobacteria bacterium]|nr:EAL domain-containing protein [Gammaproteobacteria bacterium]
MKPRPAATILIVDDNPNNLRVLENILVGAGYRILPAMSGASALRAVQKVMPDVVLLDVRMPEMDGYEVCRRLKESPGCKDLPIIFISALQETEDKLKAFRVGGVDYITKPFHSLEVLSRVKTHVDLSHSRHLLAEINENLEEKVAQRTTELTASNARLDLAMRREQALRKVLTLSHSAMDLQQCLARGLEWLSEIFQWHAPQRKTAIFLTRKGGESRQMDIVASVGIPAEQLEYCASIHFRDCLCGEAANEQCVINVDMAHCPSDLRYPDSKPRGRIALPLISEGRTLGVLMHTIEGAGAVSDDERHLLEQVVDILSISIARRYAYDHIAYLAYHDELTGMMNRHALLEQMASRLQPNATEQGGFAVIFVDMDHFKQINDVLGHHAGDNYLKSAAQRIAAALTKEDALSRWGSDEFVVLAPDGGSSREAIRRQVQALAQRLTETLEQPFEVERQEVQLNASIGIALYPGDGESAAELVQHAELALSRAKASGRHQIQFYQPQMQQEAAHRMILGHHLRRAISNQQFTLHYQPQTSMTGELLGAEALIRWQHPEQGLISPLDFIPLAEEMGFIVPLGEWVLSESGRWLGDLGDASLGLMKLSVNVSARQFYERNFVDRCLAILREGNISPERIELEVTESLLLDNIENARAKISTLRDNGFCFAVDDFGTGYSSLGYLKSLPVQKLKIDRAFVQDVHLDSRNLAIVRTIITLAKNLGMTTIAEGVEKREEVDFLYAAGCDAFQGYYFGKPITGENFVATWLNKVYTQTTWKCR